MKELRKPRRRAGRALPVAFALAAAAFVAVAAPAAAQPTFLPELDDDGYLFYSGEGVPTVCAATDHDVFYLLGWAHARDRFFQMDTRRRQFSGTLAELLGPAAVPSDVQLRTLGLRRAAEESLAAYAALDAEEGSASPAALEAYSAGVNAWLARNPLPPEYTALEITAVPEWTVLDSLTVAKGIALGLSFDLSDIDLTIAFGTYTATGSALGFDGAALFSEDVFRSQPFDDTVSIPAAAAASGASRATPSGDGSLDRVLRAAAAPAPRALELARRYRDRVAEVPLLARALDGPGGDIGSNWWLVSAEKSSTGHPLLANDPHLGLDTPSTFYEAQLIVSGEVRCGIGGPPVVALQGTPRRAARSTAGAAALHGGELNASGVSFAGVPGLVQGCNQQICWGSTVNPMDVTDVYQEEVVIDQASGLPVATMFDGVPEPLVLIPQSFRFNLLGDGIADNSTDAGVGPLDGGLTLVVPRRNNGPIVTLSTNSEGAIGLSIQYTGWRGTLELEAFLRWLRAENRDDFVAALQYFDVGSQNWAFADVHGDIAYFTSAEMPLREDLQTLNQPDGGVPPFFIRDGTHTLRHEWLPAPADRPLTHAIDYQILPFEEMPQVVNPAAGYIVNANNDPVGTTLDNNPLNQLRPGGGLYYLNPGYSSLRVGRIGRLMEALLAGGNTASPAELEAIQANNQLLDAELLAPLLFDAFTNAVAPGSPPELVALGTDPEVAEAIARLRGWDFSTPTGLRDGYDPGDDPEALQEPDAVEVANSVAATLWAVWRSRAIANVVDATLERAGLGTALPGSRSAYVALAHRLRSSAADGGVGASGLDFFAGADAPTAAERRDLLLLRSLREALDRLAGDPFAVAFDRSTDQDDYRWGRLHRIVFDHPLGSPFSVPPGGGFADLEPGLPGVARSGGYEAVDASSHSARADAAGEYMFGSGPARRFVGVLDPAGIDAEQVIPGGQRGVLGDPGYAGQLGLWLTNRYHPLPLSPEAVEQGAVSEAEFTSTGVPCVPTASELCLQDGRFRIAVDWQTPLGTQGGGRVVSAVGNQRSGLFWFFNPDNWELLVKVLDGCPINGHFWVFVAGTTNVGWEMTVEDTATGETWSGSNPVGERSRAITDTAAFATCP